MAEEYEAWSPEASGDMGSMIEPMYEDDIETVINEVRPEDVQHFDNKAFVRITDEQMPEILKFIDESDQFQFEDWAIIGETKGEDEESIPGSSERPPVDPSAAAAAQRKGNAASSKTASSPDAAPAEHCVEEEEEQEEANVEGDEEEDVQQEDEELPNENENSMVFSMFLSNWEDQVRQIREAKRLEWEKRMKELLGNEQEEQQQQKKPNEKEFVDDDGDSWVLLDNDDPAPATDARSTDLQVAVVDASATTSTQVARRTGFFESWPSFEVGSKLGGSTQR